MKKTRYQDVKDLLQWLTTVSVFAAMALPYSFTSVDTETLAKYLWFFEIPISLTIIAYVLLVLKRKEFCFEGELLESLKKLGLAALFFMAIIFLLTASAPRLLENAKGLRDSLFLLMMANLAMTAAVAIIISFSALVTPRKINAPVMAFLVIVVFAGVLGVAMDVIQDYP